MPVYSFRCPHGHSFNKSMSVGEFKDSKGLVPCKEELCSFTARRVRKAATSQAMEVLDDGIRPQRVERLADAERIFREREEAHDQKYGTVDPEE